MIKKIFILINMVAVIALYICAMSEDNQIKNYGGGFFVVLSFAYMLSATIIFFISSKLDDEWAYGWASSLLDFDKSKSYEYLAMMDYIIPIFAFVGLCVLYPGIYASGFYVVCLIVYSVSMKFLEQKYSEYE